jgi:plasmid replication initiation protein
MKQIKDLVVKHNDLNAVNYFKSSVHLKIFSKLITKVRENPDEDIYKLSIKQILKDIEAHNKDYSKLKNVAKSMFKVIDMPVKQGFKLSALFVKIETDERSFIGFKINSDLKPYILNLSKNFTCYFFENISKLNSRFSIRIYELLKQFQNPKTLEGWLKTSVKDLRDFVGIEKYKYKQYNDFKKRVILTAQKELEEKTDLKFIFGEIKEAKKIVAISFEILPNLEKVKEKKLEEINPKIDLAEQEQRKKHFNIILTLKDHPFLIADNEELETLINLCKTKEIEEEDLQNAIFAVKENIESDKIETSIFRQLKSAISQKWKPKINVEKRKMEERDNKISSLKHSILKLENNKKQTIDDFEHHLFNVAKQMFGRLSEEEQKKRKALHIDELKSKIDRGAVKKEIFEKMLDNFAEEYAIKELKKEHFKNENTNKLLDEYLKGKNICFIEEEKKINIKKQELFKLEYNED